MSLKQKTISGLLWSLAGRFGQQAMQFAISVYLARILMPKDFGAVVMVLVITEFAMLFLVHGFPVALIQKENLREAHVHSIFWFNAMLAAVLSLALFASAPLIAEFYDLPLLSPMMRVMAGGFFLSSLVTVPRVMLQREMRFKSLALIETVVTMVSGAIAVVLARAGFGVWTLVMQICSSGLLTSLGVWLAARWRPKMLFEAQAVRELVRFSSNYVGTISFHFWADNIEKMLIGRLLGSASLGIYNRAMNQVGLITSQIDTILYQVMFPVLSSVQQDKARVKSIYLEAVAGISLIAFPALLGLMVVAGPFIQVVYGEKWLAVAPIMQIACVAGLMITLMAPTKWIYTSQGRTDWMFRWELGSGAVLMLCKCLGGGLGTAKAIAIAIVAANFLLLYPGIMIAGKIINMKFVEVARAISGPLLCGIIMAFLLVLIRRILPQHIPAWAVLLTQFLCGLAFYGTALHLFRIRAYLKLRAAVSEKLRIHSGRKLVLSSG